MRLPLSNLILSATLWLLLVELLQFLDTAKGDPINDGVIHAHYERRRDDKFTVFRGYQIPSFPTPPPRHGAPHPRTSIRRTGATVRLAALGQP